MFDHLAFYRTGEENEPPRTVVIKWNLIVGLSYYYIVRQGDN
jgi:hypothetical protein